MHLYNIHYLIANTWKICASISIKKKYFICLGYTPIVYSKDPTLPIQMSRSLHISQSELQDFQEILIPKAHSL